MALDTFWIQDLEGKPFDGPQRLARLAARVELALSNRLDIPRELDSQRASWPKRDRVFTVEPRVLIDNNASDTFTVIEVNGRDRPGLLYRLTRCLSDLNLQISSAKISTFGQRAVDVFYVKDQFGLKVESEARLKSIRAGLMQVLEPESPAAAAPSEEDSATAAQ
jgi:[protein-PII] uridylyltransferase